MATIEQITSTSFTEMIGVANNTNTLSIDNVDHTQVKLMSRYSNFVENDPAILNTDYINEALTHIWTTRNNNNDSFGWCVDQKTGGESNRGALDRFVWSGSILSNDTTGETWLSSHVVSGQDLQTTDSEDTETEYETDGLVIIPQPNCELSTTMQTVDTDIKQMAVKIKVKFDDLPAYKWIPLFGYTTCMQGASVAGNNIGKPIHVSKLEHMGYRTPIAIATTEDNILGINPIGNVNLDHRREGTDEWNDNSPYALPVAAANLTTYFIYCHDGDGNGMLATCAGELPVPVSNTAVFTGYPRNEHFNVHDGITKWSAPPALDENEPLFSDPVQRDLQALWRKYGGDGQARSDGAEDYKKLFRVWYKYWREDFKTRVAVESQGSFLSNNHLVNTRGWGSQRNFAPLWNTTQLQGNNSSKRYYWQHRDITFASSYITSDVSPNQYEDEWGDIMMIATGGQDNSAQPSNSNSTINDPDLHYSGFGNICWNYGQLIAYGPTNNSDLSSETELHINVTRTVGDKNMLIGSGIYSDEQPDSFGDAAWLQPNEGPGRDGLYVFNNHDRVGDEIGSLNPGYDGKTNRYGISRRPVQMFWTGKLLDFTFRDALGPVCYTNQRYEFRALINRNAGTVEGGGENKEYGQMIDGLILRSVPGCKLYSGTIGSYAKTGTDQGYPSTVQNNNNVRPGNNTELAFTSEGLSYGPIVNARVNPDKHQNAAGVRMDSLSDPAWTDVPNLFDSDTNTVSVIKDAGESNALYVEMNGVINPAQPVPDDDREIETFTLALRGIRQLSLTRHRIRLAIVDSTKTDTLFETGDATNPDIIVEVNNTVSFPSGGQAYTFTIDTTGLTYGQVKDGFIKIWTEAVV